MKYTFWHCGALMGDAQLRKNPANPRQVFGPFRPTEYGRTLLPQLTGILAAGAALKEEMEARGMSEDSLASAEEVGQFLDQSPAGQRVMDVGRIISDMELRDHTGAQVPFQSIGFLDLASLAQLAIHPAPNVRPPAPAFQVMVSATLSPRRHWGVQARRIEIT